MNDQNTGKVENLERVDAETLVIRLKLLGAEVARYLARAKRFGAFPDYGAGHQLTEQALESVERYEHQAEQVKDELKRRKAHWDAEAAFDSQMEKTEWKENQ